MRIYTHSSQLLYVSAISSLGDGSDVNGRLYQLHAGYDIREIAFQSQPFEQGCNGITNEALIAVLKHRLGVLNERLPCQENTLAIDHLHEALLQLEAREARVAAERRS